MKVFVPDYYGDFHCIAEKCRHNCCIGWEIDIDDDTLRLYDAIGGSIGKRLKDSISLEDCPHFILTEGERCPFLNRYGLCDIITELGDGALCDICADHPRYRNYSGDSLEMGLGLSCEEAARLILTKKTPTVLLSEETGESAPLSDNRRAIIETLQNRSIPFANRLSSLFAPPSVDLFKLFASLERLDSKWGDCIELLKTNAHDALLEFDTAFEQLAVYFVLRYTSNDSTERLGFALFSVYIIRHLAAAFKEKSGALSVDELIELCRMYSSEIEYSDINVDEIVAFLQK